MVNAKADIIRFISDKIDEMIVSKKYTYKIDVIENRKNDEIVTFEVIAYRNKKEGEEEEE